METRDIAHEAADKALTEWLKDEPSSEPFEDLDTEDLRHAAHILVVNLGNLLRRTYGGAKEVLVHFERSVYYDDAPLSRTAAQYLASRSGWFCTTVVETDSGGFDVTLRLDGTYTNRDDAERAADLVDVTLADALGR